jgi:tryptophan synthase alpha chain
MNRLTRKLLSLRGENKKALSMFITAGYPSPDATIGIVLELERSGADIIELGIPFSDPLADGPTIQKSSDIAIKNGTTLRSVLSMVERIRNESDIPLVLMGYVNPLLAYGLERFMEDAAARGADGVIVPDIPIEEAEAYRNAALTHNLSPVFLAAPTSTDGRLKKIDELSEGFVYCVSITGVTGRSNGLPAYVEEYLRRCKKHIVKNPMLVGFGISTADDARKLAPHADGVIVGSALIQCIMNNPEDRYLEPIAAFVRELRNGLDQE